MTSEEFITLIEDDGLYSAIINKKVLLRDLPDDLPDQLWILVDDAISAAREVASTEATLKQHFNEDTTSWPEDAGLVKA